MKRILAVVLAIAMIFAFAACGKEETAEKSCLNCNEIIMEDDAFCKHCGTEQNITNKNSPSDDISFAGIYLTDDWNGRNATIRLNEDGSCVTHMGDTGTWKYEDNKIIISYIYTYEFTDTTETKTMYLDVVKDGLIYSSMFFKKM